MWSEITYHGYTVKCGHRQFISTVHSEVVSPNKMRSVLCVAVVLCLLQCCSAVPLEEFVGYPFSNETHQVYKITRGSYYYNLPVNISQPFVIDGRGLTGLWVSHFLAATLFALMLIMS